MSPRAIALAALLTTAACGPNDGNAVDLTVLVDPSVDDAALATVKTLTLAVSGAETYSTTYLVQMPIAGRRAKLIYRPGVSSGNDTFAVTLGADTGPVGYGTSPAVALAGGTTSATVTVTNMLPPGGDGGGGDGSMCSSVATCAGGDGCCPAGCNTTNDSDCMPTCGNGLIESGEVCDDGNTANGDGCDPTCRYANVASLALNGRAGGTGYNDAATGISVRMTGRYDMPLAMDQNSGFFYVVDDGVLREINTSTGSTNAVLGLVNDVRPVDGTGAQVRFGQVRGMTWLAGLLYVIDYDQSGNSSVRAIDLSGSKSVTTINFTGVTLTGQQSLGSDAVNFNPGTTLYIADNSGFYTYVASTKVTTLLAAASAFSVVGTISACQGGVALMTGPNYYLACGTAIAQVTGAGVVSLYAGAASTTGNVNQGGVSPPFTTARFGYMNGIVANNNILYVSDNLRYGIRSLAASQTNNFAPNGADGAGTSAYAESNNLANVRFILPGRVAFDPNHNRLAVIDNGQSVRTIPLAGGSTLPLAGVPQLANGDHCAPSVTDGAYVYCVDQGISALTRISLATGGPAQSMADCTGSASGINDVALIGNTLYIAIGDATIRSLSTTPAGSPPAAQTLPIVAGTVDTGAPPQDGPAASARLYAVSLASDGTDLYFFDRHAAGTTLRKVSLSGMTVSTVSAAPFTNDVLDGVGDAAHFSSANGLRFDGSQFVFYDGVVNGGVIGSVVRRFDPATGAITTLAGTPGVFEAGDGTGGAARFSGIRSVTSDGRAVFVADAADLSTFEPFDDTGPRIREVELPTGRTTTMIGQAGHYAVVPGTGTSALVNQPKNVVYDPTGKRILVWDSSELVWMSIQ
jgi:cysteine-rich repeat protein